MIKIIFVKLISALLMLSTVLFANPVLAHSGHSHAQLGTLGGILHSLTTHPMLWGLFGLVIIAASYLSND